jgi:hypothetical protein
LFDCLFLIILATNLDYSNNIFGNWAIISDV